MPELGNTRFNAGNGKPDFSYMRTSNTVDINSSKTVSDISDSNIQRIIKLELDVTLLTNKLNFITDKLNTLLDDLIKNEDQ